MPILKTVTFTLADVDAHPEKKAAIALTKTAQPNKRMVGEPLFR
jgi:hypothetical protein